MIVLLCSIVVIGSVFSLYFSLRSCHHLDKALEHLNIAHEAINIAIMALHCNDMDELEIMHQRLEELKRKNQCGG